MNQKRRARRAIAVLTVTALGGLAGWTGLAGAHTGTAPFNITPGLRRTAVIEDPIHVNMRRGTQVITTQLTVAPGGHTAWHYHPGPHVVAVTAGTVTVYETDCTERGVYLAGGGFFDPGSAKPRHIHTLYNPGPAVAEVVITDFREPGRVPTVPADPQPRDCF